MNHEHVVYFVLFAFILGGVFGIVFATGLRRHHLHDLGQHVRARGLDCPVCEYTYDRPRIELSPLAYSAFLDLHEILLRERAETGAEVVPSWAEETLTHLATKMSNVDVKDAIDTVAGWHRNADDIGNGDIEEP